MRPRCASHAFAAALTVLALAAGGAGIAPSTARAMDDYATEVDQHPPPIACKAAIPKCGYHGPTD